MVCTFDGVKAIFGGVSWGDGNNEQSAEARPCRKAVPRVWFEGHSYLERPTAGGRGPTRLAGKRPAMQQPGMHLKRSPELATALTRRPPRAARMHGGPRFRALAAVP